MQAMRPTFQKHERIVSQKLIEKLFGGGCSKSLVSFPVRMVYMYMLREEAGVPVQVLVSVSKRHFKRAVKRNRVKRQMREGYRLNKEILLNQLAGFPDKSLAIAFIWMTDDLRSSKVVHGAVRNLLVRLGERMSS